MSKSTAKYGFLKPELTDAADITAYNANWDKLDTELTNLNTKVISATSTDGVTYYATVSNLTELYNGLELTIVPNKTSASTTPALNVNGLGAKTIKIPMSINTSAMTTPNLANFLGEGRPVKVMYDTGYSTEGIWKLVDKQKTSASDLYGNVPIEHGGTGSDNGATGLKNLLAAGSTVLSSYQYGITLPAAGTKGRIFFKKVSS